MASNKKNFRGMSYREVQSFNSVNRDKLQPEDKKLLKENGHKNIGWDNVIRLYEAIEKLLLGDQFENWTLEELFLEADRIGNKYLSSPEVEQFNQRLAKEVEEISEEIDKQFAYSEIEFIDFSQQTSPRYGSLNKRDRKNYKS